LRKDHLVKLILLSFWERKKIKEGIYKALKSYLEGEGSKKRRMGDPLILNLILIMRIYLITI
jgi:hypothetical protein